MIALALPMAVIFLPLAYLLGSIPFGYIIVKLREGRDVRAAGGEDRPTGASGKGPRGAGRNREL